MKLRGLFSTFLLAIILAFVPTESADAMTSEKEQELKEIWTDIAFAGTISGDKAIFEEGEAVDPYMSFWYLSMNGRLTKYYSDESWCYELTISEYMTEMGLAFQTYDVESVKEWLQKNNYYDPAVGDQVSIYAGGFGDIWAWIPTDITCDGNRYTVNGLYLYGVEETGDVDMATDQEFYDYWMYTSNYYYEGEYHSDTYAMGIQNAISATIEETEDGYIIVSYDKPNYYCYENTLYCENPETKEFDQSYTMRLEYKTRMYVGLEIEPKVILKDRCGKQVETDCYRVNYQNNIEIGEATAICTITHGEYEYTLSGEFIIKPKNLVVDTSNIKSTGKVKLTWERVEDAEKYLIYRATSKNGVYKLMKTTTSTSYINTSAKTGLKYYYKVIVYVNGIPSDGTVVSQVCTLAQPKLTVDNVLSSGKIKLTWNEIDCADMYAVYRATSKDGNYSLMKYTKSTSYINTSTVAGKKYYYKVIALYYDDSSAYSAYSEIKSKICDLARPVVKVTNVANTGKIKVSWEKVTGADKYKVYRATSENGKYTLMKTTTSTSYTNTSASAGKKYYYKVVAVCEDNSSANSAYSSVKSRVCDLAKPKVKLGTTGTGKPKLSWGKVEGATKYEIWRKVGSNGTYEKYYTTTGTTYSNTSVKSGTTYYYKIVAVYGSNKNANSAYSNVVAKTIE